MKQLSVSYPERIRRTPSVYARALGQSLFVWTLSLAALLSPWTNTVARKALFLATPLIFSSWITLLRPAEGFAVWSLGLTILVSQTSYQLDLGRVRTSALELVLVGLLVLLPLARKWGYLPRLPTLPGQRIFVGFALYALSMLSLSFAQGIRPDQALFQFKGFVLYPLMAYVLLAGLTEQRLLRWIALLAIGWYMVVALVGMVQFIQGSHGGAQLFRASGEYAPINVFGVTLTAFSMFALGIALHDERHVIRGAGVLVAVWLFLGAIASVSRSVWIAFVFGLLILFLGRSRRGILLQIAILAAVLLLVLLPNPVTHRVLQLSDSSTQRRFFYLESGWAAWKARPLLGWGWGRAFSYIPGIGLLPTGWIPWYHNDYLNLAVQTGLVGLGLYLAFWVQVVRQAHSWLRRHVGTETGGYVHGSLAALVVLLVAAIFEHVLWRPDIGGLVGWFLGILVVAMCIGSSYSEV
ncbi:MAG TPA: O-antigen ligase family protein [Methylothermaceae bacterium]|nr:O-antigen ligase family protein [Methylothermaceae bacterium]